MNIIDLQLVGSTEEELFQETDFENISIAIPKKDEMKKLVTELNKALVIYKKLFKCHQNIL